MSQQKNRFNIAIWGFIVTLIGVIATALTVPEFRSFVGLSSDNRTTDRKEVSLITQTESGEPLAGVKVQVVAEGAPEIVYSDSNGYAKANVSNKGDVRVNLSKLGYPVQSFIINLLNDQNIVRTVRFSKSGSPEVSSLPGIPSATPAPTPIQAEEITWNDNASKLIGNVGQDFAYLCPPNGTIVNVWGTDFYTAGSSICSAAVHAGIINARDGGKVQIRIRPGEDFYNPTTRYGVTSNRYGSYKGSFVFLNSTGSPRATTQIKLIEWNETASDLQGKLDQNFTYSCPENGTVNTNIWGTDLYTIGSSICSAAVHAGIINAKDGGKVQIRIRPGEKFYNSTTRYGVKSSRYDSYSWSFEFIK